MMLWIVTSAVLYLLGVRLALDHYTNCAEFDPDWAFDPEDKKDKLAVLVSAFLWPVAEIYEVVFGPRE